MNLTTETALRGIVDTLRERIAPAIDDAFAGEAARLAGMLLGVCANAVDDAAAARVWENAALRTLFAEARPMVAGDLALRLADAARSIDPGLRISELDWENGRLRKLLVELHAAVELLPDERAQAIDARIWRLLCRVEERRAPRS